MNQKTDLTEKTLSSFKRFPRWMWCNQEIKVFIEWLQSYNDSLKVDEEKISFYLYGLRNCSQLLGGRAKKMQVIPAIHESDENFFHQAGQKQDFYLCLHKARNSHLSLNFSALERAIGVIYKPQSERLSHYFIANIEQN